MNTETRTSTAITNPAPSGGVVADHGADGGVPTATPPREVSIRAELKGRSSTHTPENTKSAATTKQTGPPTSTGSAGNRDGSRRTVTAADSPSVDAALTEREWQAKVVDLARWQGWMVFHPYDSRRSAAGWPDLSLCRGGRLVLAELKSASGRVSADQRRWLTSLSAVPGIETYLWRPSDWPGILRILGGDLSGDHLPRTQIGAVKPQVIGPVSCGCLANEHTSKEST